jgi:hypothetical protein
MSIVHKNFYGWRIYSNGTLKHIKMNYLIDSKRLEESDWLEHLSGKRWLKPLEVKLVLEEAQKIKKQKSR